MEEQVGAIFLDLVEPVRAPQPEEAGPPGLEEVLVSVEERVGAIFSDLEGPVRVPQPAEAGPPGLEEDPASVAAEVGATCLGSEEQVLADPAKEAEAGV